VEILLLAEIFEGKDSPLRFLFVFLMSSSLGIRVEEAGEEYAAWVARVRARYGQALKAVQEAQFDNGRENLYAALHYVVMEGRRLPHLLGATRMVLNALYRHFHHIDGAAKLRNADLGYHISLAGLNQAAHLDASASM